MNESIMDIYRPYEPPPDYPIDSDIRVTIPYRNPILHHTPSYRIQSNGVHYSSPSQMIRSRQYPEIAGLSTDDKSASLRSFSRFGDNIVMKNEDNKSIHSINPNPFDPYRLNPSYQSNHSFNHINNLQLHPSDNSSRSLLIRNRIQNGSLSSTQCRGKMRNSCPNIKDEDDDKRKSIKKKRNEWMKKDIINWRLDDVLLWLQSIGEEQITSLLIGYELNGIDVLEWNDEVLESIGIDNIDIRKKIIKERDELITKRKGRERISLFDIISQTCGDHVLVVETSLTSRDLIVGKNQSIGCLTVLKVNGSNVPLEEDDCLLEINGLPGEQFKSALMFTKLISESRGKSIRFVILRRKRQLFEKIQERPRDSSSGISSSSPIHHSNEIIN